MVLYRKLPRLHQLTTGLYFSRPHNLAQLTAYSWHISLVALDGFPLSYLKSVNLRIVLLSFQSGIPYPPHESSTFSPQYLARYLS